MIDAYASAPHYLAHIAPIWRALPSTVRGRFYISPYMATDPATSELGAIPKRLPRSTEPILVSAYSDYRVTGQRPVIFVEHGAGQSYVDMPTHPSYSGGRHRDRTILFICPNTTVALRNRSAYPHIPTAIVGCPRLDAYHPAPPYTQRSNPPTVAFTFHPHYGIAPETRSSLAQFKSAIELVRHAGYQVLGHGHPRAWPKLSAFYSRTNIPHTPDPDIILRTADCLVVDNSSLGFEAASLNIPLVWLSPLYFRRDVTQWPRFWDGVILGEEATTPNEVPDAVTRALQPVSPALQVLRDNFLAAVYKYRDGRASERAAEAIMAVVR